MKNRLLDSCGDLNISRQTGQNSAPLPLDCGDDGHDPFDLLPFPLRENTGEDHLEKPDLGAVNPVEIDTAATAGGSELVPEFLCQPRLCCQAEPGGVNPQVLSLLAQFRQLLR